MAWHCTAVKRSGKISAMLNGFIAFCFKASDGLPLPPPSSFCLISSFLERKIFVLKENETFLLQGPVVCLFLI